MKSKKWSVSSVEQIPGWALVVVAVCLCIYLLSNFLRYENVIAGNGDIAAYERSAVMMNALRAGVSSDTPNYYPPLANILFLSAENNILGLPFHRSLAVLFLITGITAIVYLWMTGAKNDSWWTAIAILGSITLLEPAVFFARFDFFPMLMILLACLSLRTKRVMAAGVFLILGCALKVAPVFLIPLFFVSIPTERRQEFWTGMMLGFAGVIIGSFGLLGVQATIDSLTSFFVLRTSMPPYALSGAASIDIFVRMLFGSQGTVQWIEPDLGHFDTGLPIVLSPILLLLSAGGAVLFAISASRIRNPEQHILLTASAVLFWLLFATPLLTMHYYLWVLPLPILWFLERIENTRTVRPIAALVFACTLLIGALGQWTYPHLYFDLVDRGTPLAITVNVVRNLLVLVAAFACFAAAKEVVKTR